jgi:hypothetical protein
VRALHPLLIVSLLSGAALAGRAPPSTATDAATQSATSGPKTKAPESALFNRLIGTWDVSYDLYDKDGKVRHLPGQVTYSWILDGGALQEIWSDVDGKETKPYGTMISYQDVKRGRWTAIWIYPQASMTTLVSGNEVDGSVVLTGRDQDGAIQRWSIGDVQPNSFVSRYESSQDEGKTWRLLSVNRMRRHAAP